MRKGFAAATLIVALCPTAYAQQSTTAAATPPDDSQFYATGEFIRRFLLDR